MAALQPVERVPLCSVQSLVLCRNSVGDFVVRALGCFWPRRSPVLPTCLGRIVRQTSTAHLG